MAIYLKTAQGIGLAICLMQGAANLHNSAVSAVMKSPMAFFDTTPVGRIINRFSKDLDDSKHHCFTHGRRNYKDYQTLNVVFTGV